MKAAQMNSYGGVDVLEVNTNTPTPKPAHDQVLVKVVAASINPIDWKVREGYLKDMVPLTLPIIVGGDFSGIITEVGNGVSGFLIGDPVYGQGGVLGGGSGAFAEFVTAKTGKIIKKPKTLDFIHAAALPLVGVSALQALEDHIHLQKGQKILIHGGGGGIGSIAIQIAKTLGAYIATTVGTKDREFVKELGADEVIDYQTEKFEEKLHDFDAVFDTVGGDTTEKSFHVLKSGGLFVSMAGQPDNALAKKYGVTGIGQSTDATPERLHRLSALVNSGKITVHVDKVFHLDQVKEAFTYQETGHPRGKVVIKISE